MSTIINGSTNAITFPDSTIQNTAYIFNPPQVTTYTSGSGTYTTPTGAKYLTVKMVGGGGGGGGAGSGAATGGTGGTTTFGSSLLTCTGGTGGVGNTYSNVGAGGSATLNSPATGYSFGGAQGGGAGFLVTGTYIAGGAGGAIAFGGAGCAGGANAGGGGGSYNTGAGGGGSGSLSGGYAGCGGGSGAYIDALITSPSASYTYAVGASGSAGAGGSGGQSGGAGAAGIVIVTAYF